jgi:hypothetical protein
MTAKTPDLAAIRVRVEAAHAEVVRLCKGGRWTMRVPAQPGKDSDLVIAAALDDARALAAEVERLRKRDEFNVAAKAELYDELQVAEAERDRLRALVRDLTDPDECWFDHRGGCQAHGYLELAGKERCPQAEAQEVAAALAAEDGEP